MTTPLCQLIYRSRAAKPFSSAALAALLRASRLRNQERHISGILLYAGEQFMQVIEGYEPTLTTLYDHIRADPRHTDVQLLAYGPATGRWFADWRMGYAAVAASQFEKVTGFLPLAQAPGLTAHPPAVLAQLLRSFAQTEG
ncbi:MAG: BLUF domain-containing protein [Bacteroidota bacterium]|nr:BLUF domain-containing protein [Bacteroidota bacterium]